MRTLQINAQTGTSSLLVGERLRNLARYVAGRQALIVTDANVREHYGGQFPPLKAMTIGTGERIKTLETVSRIYQELVSLEMDRSALLVGIGGGIVCDIAGFAAATYLRGIRFGFVSTSLLAQVDASVGGKNGVNWGGYKNMVGTFNQPEFVLCDLDLLKTLPPAELCSGMAEIVKHAAIADEALFRYLERNGQGALQLQREVMEKLVYDSVVIKSAIVNRDEKESGERRKLNFGHTFGHAIEKSSGVSHGAAVSVGMILAASLSVRQGLLAAEDARRLRQLLEALNLPTRLVFDRAAVLNALKRDKKRQGTHIKFVLLDQIGHAVIRDIEIEALDTFLQDQAG